MVNVTDSNSTWTTNNSSNQNDWLSTFNNTVSLPTQITANISGFTTDPTTHLYTTTVSGYGHHLKDETVYVSIIVMGFIVPSIFIFITVMICLKRRKEQSARRRQMLLHNQQDVPMNELPYNMRSHLAAGQFA